MIILDVHRRARSFDQINVAFPDERFEQQHDYHIRMPLAMHDVCKVNHFVSLWQATNDLVNK